MEQASDRSSLLVGGGVLIVIAIVLVVLLGKDGEKASCALATTGVVTVTEGLTRGHGASKIIAAGAAAGTVPLACKGAIETFVEDPTEETEIAITTPTGEMEETTSGLELTEEASAPPTESRTERIVDCFLSYRESEFLYRLCLDGVLTPS